MQVDNPVAFSAVAPEDRSAPAVAWAMKWLPIAATFVVTTIAVILAAGLAVMMGLS
jgi:hypothetical protein